MTLVIGAAHRQLLAVRLHRCTTAAAEAVVLKPLEQMQRGHGAETCRLYRAQIARHLAPQLLFDGIVRIEHCKELGACLLKNMYQFAVVAAQSLPVGICRQTAGFRHDKYIGFFKNQNIIAVLRLWFCKFCINGIASNILNHRVFLHHHTL